MGPVEIWGWVCGIASALSALPQLVRLLRARTSAGLSLLAWQLNAGVLWGWTAHGVLTVRHNLIWSNLFLACSMTAVVALIVLDRRLAWTRSLTPVVALFAVLVAIEWNLGEVVFGLVVLGPGAFALVAQFVDLLRRPDLSGVSLPALAVNAMVQIMWFSWASLATDRAVQLVSTCIGLCALANVAAYLGRWRGWLRPPG
ncbi:MAG: hypothetical protein Q3997_06445 [Propionibacteriaceae bacterium]|nr:hypothetical protein [Propionibacteriaceae bacterium]